MLPADCKIEAILSLKYASKPQEGIPEFEVALRRKPDLKSAADNLRRAKAQLSSESVAPSYVREWAKICAGR